MEPHRLKAYLILLIVYAIWGVAGPVIKFTLGGISPLSFLTYRFAISAGIALVSFAITGLSLPKDKKTLLILFIYCLFSSTISLGLLFFGLENTTVLDSTLITLAAPLLISAAGVIFLKEHVTNREKFGMTIALAGTLLTVIEPLVLNGTGGTRLSGNILILLYLVATVVPSIQAKMLLRRGVSPFEMTNLSFVIGFLTVVPFVFFAKGGAPEFLSTISHLPIQYHLGVLFMALFSGTIAYSLANRAQKTIEVGEASVFSYLYPIFSTPLAVLWLGEKITPAFILGGLIIAIGVVIAEYKKSRYNKPHEG